MILLHPLEKRPYRHSYSSIKKYKECPRAYALEYISKVPAPPSAAMMRGTRLHKLAEDYMGNVDATVPYDIRKIGLTIYQLRSKGAVAEQTWLLDADWSPTDKLADAKIKAVIDVHWTDNELLRIHDYKSGREYPEHEFQLEFYALVGLQRHPAVQRAESSAIYIDTGREGNTRSIIRPMLDKLKRPWEAAIARMDDDREFAPNAGGACKWCAHRDDKGGPCGEWRNAK